MSTVTARTLLTTIALFSAAAGGQPALRDLGELNVDPTNDVASIAISPDGPLNRGIAQQFMVADDGQRFLVLAAQPASSPVHLLGGN
jgi:hypothetical protein